MRFALQDGRGNPGPHGEKYNQIAIVATRFFDSSDESSVILISTTFYYFKSAVILLSSPSHRARMSCNYCRIQYIHLSLPIQSIFNYTFVYSLCFILNPPIIQLISSHIDLDIFLGQAKMARLGSCGPQ